MPLNIAPMEVSEPSFIVDKIIKHSGDICEVAGIYWLSGCGHAAWIEIEAGAAFPACEVCGKEITWHMRIFPGAGNQPLPVDQPTPPH